MVKIFSTLTWKQLVLATLLYILVFIVYTYPLITHFATHIIGGARGGDAAQYTWNSFVFKQNLFSGKNPFYSNNTYYPLGTNLWFHTYTPFISLFSLPFSNLFLALNIITVLQFVFSGIGGLLLSQRVFKNYTFGLLTGFVFAFSTYKMMHLLGHYHLMLTATIPFYIMAMMDAFPYSESGLLPSNGRFKNIVWMVALLIITFFSDYYATFYLLFFSTLYLIFPYVRTFYLSLLPFGKWAIMITLFIGSHKIVTYYKSIGVDDRGAFWWLPDFTFFFVPSFRSFWFNTRDYYMRMGGKANVELPIFLGWTLIALCIFTVVLHLKHKKHHPTLFYFWVFVLVFFAGMVIPELKLFDTRLFYLPTGIYYIVPFFNNIRIPGRAIIMVYLFLPLVIGYLWVNYKNIIPPKVFTWIPILALVLLMIEFKPVSYTLMNKNKNAAVSKWIKHKPGKVLFPLPLGLEDGMVHYGTTDVGLMTDQITHEKKLLGGYASRVKPEVFAYYNDDPVCKAIYDLEDLSPRLDISPKRNAYMMDPALIKAFMQKFSPDLILIQPQYQNQLVHKFIQLNFKPYIVAEDAFKGNTLYTLKRP